MLFGGVKTRCLIDSGVEVSTITTVVGSVIATMEAYLREHSAPMGQTPLDTTLWLQITAGNGTPIPY